MIIKLSIDKVSEGRHDYICQEYLKLNGIMEITIDGMTILKLNFEDEEIEEGENLEDLRKKIEEVLINNEKNSNELKSREIMNIFEKENKIE